MSNNKNESNIRNIFSRMIFLTQVLLQKEFGNVWRNMSHIFKTIYFLKYIRVEYLSWIVD